MNQLNIEIKAKCSNLEHIRKILKERNADFKGTDFQTDTYFKVPIGKLKLREGNIGYSFVYYKREEKNGPKKSDVFFFHPPRNSSLKEILSQALGILIVIKKKREIYFIDNIKFHIDKVEKLGNFIEIEAIDENKKIRQEQLFEQCNLYMKLFKLKKEDLIENSYSDLLMNKEIEIKEGTIKDVVTLSRKIPEFEAPYNENEYERRLSGKKHLILIAYVKNTTAGFKVGYEIEDAFYSWMRGVLPEFRNINITKKLAKKQEEWVKENGFKKIRLKTLNKHKVMLHFVLSSGFEIIDFEPKENYNESRIILEKIL